jgi:dihydroorotate dehydrogenase (fumarate)
MINLSTEYLGLKLKGPLVVSSTPLSESLDNARKMEECGAAAIVMTSLFEEQLALESRALDSDLERGTESFAESTSYLPDYSKDYRTSQDSYLERLRKTKAALGIPVIGSINGATPGGWVRFAKDVEQAGADALELNTYSLAIDANVAGEKVEQQLLELVAQVRANVKIPLAVKLSPQYTSIPNLARRLDATGVNGLVLFNRFYQPDFDIEEMSVVPRLKFSTPDELLLRLHWTAILYGHLKADLAVTGGVHAGLDVIKSVMAGANVAMTTSALHLYGIGHIATILRDARDWMEEHDYPSLRQMRGALSRQAVPDSSPFERGNYIKTLSAYTLRMPQN